MTTWDSIIAEEIDRQTRQDAAECGLVLQRFRDSRNLNAASPACCNGLARQSAALAAEDMPTGTDVEDWRSWMRERYRAKIRLGTLAQRENALAAVWDEALRAHHFMHGVVPGPDRCAGCGDDLPYGAAALTLLDGARVHGSDACLEAYGNHCRAVSHTALVGMGLNPPT